MMIMDYKLILGGMAVVATLIQYGTYIIDILKGKTRPHAFTWFVWGFPCGVVFAAQYLAGGGPGTWITAMTGIICTAIFILSFFYGEKNITKLDWAGLLIAIFSIVLWMIIKNPLGSVLLITFIDLVGFVPTMRKSIHKPHEETLNTYVTGGVKWILALLAMSNYSFIVWIYPAAMVFANWAFELILIIHRIAHAKRSELIN